LFITTTPHPGASRIPDVAHGADSIALFDRTGDFGRRFAIDGG
jgi:hypothetical protein